MCFLIHNRSVSTTGEETITFKYFNLKPSVNMHSRVAHSNIISRISLYLHFPFFSIIHYRATCWQVTQQRNQVRSLNGIATSTNSTATKIPAFVSGRYRIMWTTFERQDSVLFSHFARSTPKKSFCSLFPSLNFCISRIYIITLYFDLVKCNCLARRTAMLTTLANHSFVSDMWQCLVTICLP